MAIQPFLSSDDAGYDYELTDTGDKKLISGSEEIAQHLKQRLQFFLGEWIFDIKAGFPWFQKVFIKPVNISLINSLIKREILQTPGVTAIVDYQSNFNVGGRVFSVSFRYTDTISTEPQSLEVILP
jgi:hypothetical protein